METTIKKMKSEELEKWKKELEKRFTYHSPHGSQATRYEMLRNVAHSFALDLLIHVNPSINTREFALALTNLEQAVMWANAAIARNE